MGAPESGLKAGDQPGAEALLTAFRTIKDDERARHASVLDYWLSIRGDKEFPPLHDLDPLEISDASASSILLELIGGGQDAEIRHLGEVLADDVAVQRLIDAPSPSLLSCIARKLPIVAISREFLSFEDNFTNADGLTRCWITLLPLSSCGSWVDYVYAFVSIEKGTAGAAKPAPEMSDSSAEHVEPETVAEAPEALADEPVVVDAVTEETETVAELPAEDPEPEVAEAAPDAEQPAEPVEELVEETVAMEAGSEPEPETESAPETGLVPEAAIAEEESAAKGSPGFSGILGGLASLAGFYGQGVKVTDPVVEIDMAACDPLPAEPEVAEAPEPALAETAEPELAETAELEPDQPVAEPQIEGSAAELEDAAEPMPEAAEPATPQPVAADDQPLELDVPAHPMEGSLENKLTEVRAKADEARQAALRATAALHEGLSAAYDFALDAETSPEEYLRLVEAQGLKIQLRAPMAPVAKLAFEGLIDADTLGQCEKILTWALKEELPRGALLERINEAGGISELAGVTTAKAA